MNDFLYIKNWNEWQSYRKDRGTPPWIKVHRNLMSNPKWAALSDAEKGQILSIWIVAADSHGKVANNANVLRKQCQLDDAPNLLKFQELDFLTTTCQPVDNQLPPEPPQDDAPETETETEVYRKETDTEREREAALPDFKNLKFEGEFLEIAKSEGWQGESAMVVWKKWKAHFEPLGPAEEWLKSWKKWVLKERKPPNSGSPADEEKALEGEELRIQHLGSAAWRRKEKMSLNPEQSRMLEDYEKLNGIVWWDNLRQYKQGKPPN